MAVRGGWDDPSGPYWSAGSILVIALVIGVLAVRCASPLLSYVAGLLLCGSSSLLWWHKLPQHTLSDLAHASVMALSVGSLLWSLTALLRR